MNINKIKEIVDQNLPDSQKEYQLYELLSNDPKVIPMILRLIELERTRSKEVLLDTNLELSKATIVLMTENTRRRNKMIPATVDAIKEHYHKWQNVIRICFNKQEFPGYQGR